MCPLFSEKSMFKGDATQQLLTALGRFQRCVASAEQGAPAEIWYGECRTQLLAGIEIARGEGWTEPELALADTLRLLETCEITSRLEWCLPVLKEQYELLCLMVGDLIVGANVSGIWKKWRRGYARTVTDLADAGITLEDPVAAQNGVSSATSSSGRTLLGWFGRLFGRG